MSDTVRLDTCNNCIGKGETRCNLCDGGRKRCSNCVGRGTYYTNGGKKMLCSVCNACGRVSCNDCRGTGWKRCTVCNGNRQSYMYASLQVTFTSGMRCKVCGQCQIPEEELNKASGISSY